MLLVVQSGDVIRQDAPEQHFTSPLAFSKQHLHVTPGDVTVVVVLDSGAQGSNAVELVLDHSISRAQILDEGQTLCDWLLRAEVLNYSKRDCRKQCSQRHESMKGGGMGYIL